MAVWAPGDYLTSSPADYFTIYLDIPPHETVTYIVSREQVIVPFDDGSEVRIDMDDHYIFFTNVTWKNLSYTDATTIISIMMLNTRGNGITRSFYWVHPTDGYRYSVRCTKLPTFTQLPPDLWNIKVTFRLIGRYVV